MGSFFIDTRSGQVATKRQLIAAGLCSPIDDPQLPWHPIRGDIDASTLWYSVLRKQERGIWLGTVAFRRGDHHLLLLRQGWEEIDIEEIAAFGPEAGAEGDGERAEIARSPFDD
ncbi:hypothetical protein SK069_02370 [Patulibacter brassicae]|uniref:Uncharacterized protein n=1 Tax=Patulibacter brassicae TaxID=1705717 RepID=A0ABU4VHV8_9ACTN|nr:hypothetical protein [Patulibacter brassicae]MDX8150425.1 hypothetical protein [Patulibacter brassicae]